MTRRFYSLLPALLLAGCKESALTPGGPVALAERTVLLDALAIMLAIVVPTILATLAFTFWFRRSNVRVKYQADWAYSGKIELIVWSIPALVVLFLGGIGWISSHELDPAKPLESKLKPLEIEVVSLDWKWLFLYPEQKIASVNRLVVPAGVPLHLKLTSATVMNAFFVPRIGSQIYTMYGMTTQLYLQADKPGSYPGLSGHFSGDGFSGMTFNLDAMRDADFTAWAKEAGSMGDALDEAAYRELLKQSMNVTPYTYKSVTPGLFDRIVGQQLLPGDGPKSDPAGAKSRGKTS